MDKGVMKKLWEWLKRKDEGPPNWCWVATTALMLATIINECVKD